GPGGVLRLGGTGCALSGSGAGCAPGITGRARRPALRPELVGRVDVLHALVEVGDLVADDAEDDASGLVDPAALPLGPEAVDGHRMAPAVDEDVLHSDVERPAGLLGEPPVHLDDRGLALEVARQGVASWYVAGAVRRRQCAQGGHVTPGESIVALADDVCVLGLIA